MPSYLRQHQPNDRHNTSNSNQSSQSTADVSQEEQSGLVGWFQEAGNWLANSYEQTTNGIGNWVNGVTNSAQNVIDVVQQTSIEHTDGTWNINTDLDEVMDLIPTSALNLDRDKSDNKVNIQIDRNNGEVRLRSANLAISGLNVNGIRMDSGTLQNIEIVLSNATADIPLLGEFTVGSKNQKQTANITVGTLIGNNVQYALDGEHISAQQISLSNAQFSSTNGKEGFGEANTQGSFQVDSAEVIGLNTSTVSGNLSTEQARGSFDTANQSASFAAQNIAGNHLRQDNTQMNDAQLRSVQGNITQGANGHVANVSARSVAVGQLDSSALDVEAAQLDDVHLQYGSHHNSFQASASNSTVEGLAAGTTSISAADIDNLAVTSNNLNKDTSVSAEQVNLNDVDTDAVDLDSAQFTELDLQYSTADQTLQGTAQQANGQGLSSSAATVEDLNIQDLAIRANNHQLSANSSGLNAQGVSSQGLNVATVETANLQTQADWRKKLEINASAADLTAADLTHSDHSLSNVNGSAINVGYDGAQSTFQASAKELDYQGYTGQTGHSATGRADDFTFASNGHQNAFNVSASSLQVTDTSIAGHQADELSLQGLHGAHRTGSSSVSVNHLSGAGLQSQGVHVGSADLIDVQGTRQGSQIDASLSSGSVQQASGFDGRIDSAELSNLAVSANTQTNDASVSLDQATLGHAQLQDNKATELQISSLRAEKQGSNLHSSLGALHGKGLQATNIGSIEEVSAQNLTATSDGTIHQASLSTADLSGVQEYYLGSTVDQATIRGAKVMGSDLNKIHGEINEATLQNVSSNGVQVEAATIRGARGIVHEDTTSSSVANASFQNARYLDQVNVAQGDAKGLTFDTKSNRQSGSFEALSAQDIETNLPQIRSQANSAQLSGGRFTHTGEGKGSTSLDSAKLDGLSFQAQNSMVTGESYNPDATPVHSNIDALQAASSLLARVDNADIHAQANLQAGTYGEGMASATIQDGTELNSSIKVRDNQLQDGSKVQTSKPVDTALWTSTDGIYVRDSKMMGSVNGWFDINVGKKVNQAAGLEGKELHSLSDYGQADLNIPQNLNASTPINPIDLSSLRVHGSVGLSDGLVNAGDASFQLKGSEQGANQIGIATEADRLSMAFAQMMAASININTDQGKVGADEAIVDEASISASPTQGFADGTIGSITIKGVSGQR